jgi:hypothetical protein
MDEKEVSTGKREREAADEATMAVGIASRSAIDTLCWDSGSSPGVGIKTELGRQKRSRDRPSGLPILPGSFRRA